MSVSEGPPGLQSFSVSDVYLNVGDTIKSGQKYLSLKSDGAGGQIDIIFYQVPSGTVTQIAGKGHQIQGQDDWLITVE